MNIGIDIDGVLRNFTGKLVEVFRRELPDEHIEDAEDFTAWELERFTSIGKRIYDFAFHSKFTKEIYECAAAYSDADWFLESLNNAASADKYCDVIGIWFVSTQPTVDTEIYTINWLREQWFLKHFNIFFAKNKAELPIDLLLDDKVQNLEGMRDAGKIAVCMDRPWNQDWEYERVSNFRDAYAMIARYYSQWYLGKYNYSKAMRQAQEEEMLAIRQKLLGNPSGINVSEILKQ